MGYGIFFGSVVIAIGLFVGLTNMATLIRDGIVEAARIKSDARIPHTEAAQSQASA